MERETSILKICHFVFLGCFSLGPTVLECVCVGGEGMCHLCDKSILYSRALITALLLSIDLYTDLIEACYKLYKFKKILILKN